MTSSSQAATDGAGISALCEELRSISRDAWNRHENQVEEARRKLDCTAYNLRQLEYDHDELVVKKTWAESELRGLERSLGIVDELPENRSQDIGPRLTRRLDMLRLTATHLDQDIAETASRVRTERRILARQVSALLRRLRDWVEEARLESLRRTAAMLTSAHWSPVPVAGFRWWDLRTHQFVGSRQPWTSSRNSAHCVVAGQVPHTDGSCAKVAFGCGIYAMKQFDQLARRGTSLRTVAFGVAALEGLVVEHELGYRAERAQARALAISDERGVRFIHDQDEVDAVFAKPSHRHSLGYDSGLSPGATPWNMKAIGKYLTTEARRLTTWT